MTILEFIAKWRRVDLKERSASQEHFLDLCAVFDHPTPAAADPTGEKFCFEKEAAKHGGGDGFADVWKMMTNTNPAQFHDIVTRLLNVAGLESRVEAAR